MAKLDDIRPRKGRFRPYCVLYSEAGNFCSSLELAEKLCLYEPYLLAGTVNIARGGTFLWATKAELHQPGKTG